MSDYEVFNSRPSMDEAPDKCQVRGCEDHPVRTVRYKDPKEYVCYCQRHAEEYRAAETAMRNLQIK